MNTKVLAGVGIAALAVTSGNQARRHQRQNALESSGGHKRRRPKREPPPPMPIQSSEMYHDETAELAASISSYRYGAQLPGYMT